jgi:hypothetical protein
VLDDLDHRLIAIPRANRRTPVAVLARDLGVNRSTVTSGSTGSSITGVIEGFTIRLSNDVDRGAIRGVTTVVTEPNQDKTWSERSAASPRSNDSTPPPEPGTSSCS